MTREEAIRLLSGLMFKGKLKEALDMAISSFETDEAYQLEYERTTKNDLGVDTDKLIADCEKMSFDFELFGRPMKALLLDAVKNIVKDLPSVTPQEPRWIPVKFRPLTDEEQNEYPDYCYMADCPMPDDGEEILVCTVYGTVEKDECGFDDGFYLDSGYDWQTDIVAWMPLPKPFEPQESEET